MLYIVEHPVRRQQVEAAEGEEEWSFEQEQKQKR
jgi:hypothetical protein